MLLVFDFMRTLKADPDSQQPTAATRPGHSARCPARFAGPALTGEGSTAMTEQPAPQGPTITVPPQSANGNSPQLPPAPAPASGRTRTRISGMRTGLIAGFALLILVMIFIIQNAHTVSISILGALIMAAAGTARITQLRRIMRRDRARPHAS